MAKVEQFPDQTGKNERTEDVIRANEQKAEEASGAFFDIEEPEASGPFFDVPPESIDALPSEDPVTLQKTRVLPDDSLLVGTDSPLVGTGSPPTRTDSSKVADSGPAKADDSLLMGTGSGNGGPKNPDGEDAAGRPRDSDPVGTADKAPAADSGEALGVAKAVSQAYDEQIRRHRERIRYIRTLCIVSALVVIALVALYFSSRHYNRAEISKVRDFVSEEGSACVNFNGYILQYGPNGATCANTSGRVRWSITYEMDQPIISISGKTAAIADYGGRTIYVMNTKKQLCTITTSLPIHKVSASESGKVAAVLDDKNTTWIRLYSETGKEIAYFTRSMEENGYPMDVAVSPDGKKVCISSLKLKDASAVSTLNFYDFSKAGQNYDQYMVGGFEYDNEVFPYVRFIGNGTCCAASDSRMVVIDTSSTEPKNSFNNMLTENLQGIFRSGDRIGLVFLDLTRENLYRLDIFGRSGKKEGSIGFSMAFKDIQIKGNRIYINNEQSMQIYTESGREIFNGGFDRAIKVLVPRWFGALTAVSENEIDEVKLR